MKKILAMIFLMTSLSILACPGGKLELNGGLVLYGNRVISGSHVFDTVDNLGYVIDGNGVNVTILEVKADAGGVIHTIYKVEWTGVESETEIIKVETNYNGNGMRSRGLPPAPMEVDRTIGC